MNILKTPTFGSELSSYSKADSPPVPYRLQWNWMLLHSPDLNTLVLHKDNPAGRATLSLRISTHPKGWGTRR